jgi:trehalose 6-phosphate phosphatase
MSPPPALDARTPWALFLDVEALLERSTVSIQDLARLGALYERVDGALILLSERSVEEIDDLFYPLRAPCAGLHGLERRDAQGSEHRPRTDPRLAHVRPYLPCPDGAPAWLQARLSKTRALRAFLDEQPCCDRVPVYLGDDRTEEAAFEVVQECGGLTVRIGADVASSAQFCLLSADAAWDWLTTLLASSAEAPRASH